MPIANGQYVAPTWNNNNPPAIDAEELQAMCDTLEKGQTLQFENFFNQISNPTKVNNVNQIPQQARSLAAASVGNYALFGGGSQSGGAVANVYSFDSSLTINTITPLSAARSSLAGASVGNYALFGGGSQSGGSSNVVDAYDESLTHTTPDPLSAARSSLAGASVGNYALFAGGNNDESNVVDAYDESLTHTTPTPLTEARYQFAGASVGNYALFAGGYWSDNVDAYDTSLTKTIATPLSTQRFGITGTNVGEYALFCGGEDVGYTVVGTVEAYNTTLTKSTPTQLSPARFNASGTNLSFSDSVFPQINTEYAIIGGGQNTSNNAVSDVDCYNENLTRTTLSSLNEHVFYLASASIGNYALFVGGRYSSTISSNQATAYYLGKMFSIEIPACTFYNFTDAEEDLFASETTPYSGNGVLNGYIKYPNVVSGYIAQN